MAKYKERKVSLLFRYIVKNNTQLLVLTLILGIVLYILTDLFERLENFIAAQVPIKTILFYFGVKIPLIISQILPFIFLLSTIIQLCIMSKNKELVALQSGGISFAQLVKIILICSLFWGGIQFLFSEYIGVLGGRESLRIWQESVRKRNISKLVIKDIWFADKNWIISLVKLNPDDTGVVFSAYLLDQQNAKIEKIIRASSVSIKNNVWTLYNGATYIPDSYTKEPFSQQILTLTQTAEDLRVMYFKDIPQQLPIWELSDAIHKLELSGSNVEILRTSWHAKLAYAFSLVIMAILATAIVTWKNNIYFAIILALFYTFIYYAIYSLGLSLAKKGFIPPIIGAWIANIIVLFIAGWKVFFTNQKNNRISPKSIIKIH